jgi:hypothetical protein
MVKKTVETFIEAIWGLDRMTANAFGGTSFGKDYSGTAGLQAQLAMFLNTGRILTLSLVGRRYRAASDHLARIPK